MANEITKNLIDPFYVTMQGNPIIPTDLHVIRHAESNETTQKTIATFRNYSSWDFDVSPTFYQNFTNLTRASYSACETTYIPQVSAS